MFHREDNTLPDVFIEEGQELDFGQGAGVREGDDFEDDDVSSNDDKNDSNKDDPFDYDDDDDDSDYHENGKDDDPNGLDYSSDDDDNNLKFDADLEEFELVDFADPNRGKKMPVDIRMVRHLLIIRVCLQLRRNLRRKNTT